MIICKKCGGYVPDDGLFCTVCGAKRETAQYTSSSGAQQPVYNHFNNAVKPEKSKAGLIIGICAGLFVLIAIVFVSVLFFGGNSADAGVQAAESTAEAEPVEIQETPSEKPSETQPVVTTSSQASQGNVVASAVPDRVIDDYTGEWYDCYSYRCYMDISYSGNKFTVNISWSSGAYSITKWILTCNYNSSASRLEYTNGVCVDINTVDGRDVETVRYSDGSGYLHITGQYLYWIDNEEGAGDRCYFEKDDTEDMLKNDPMGYFGYSYSEFLYYGYYDSYAYVTTKGSPLNVRSYCSSDSAVIGQIENGAAVCVFGYYNGWAYVCEDAIDTSSCTNFGWVSAEYIRSYY